MTPQAARCLPRHGEREKNKNKTEPNISRDAPKAIGNKNGDPIGCRSSEDQSGWRSFFVLLGLALGRSEPMSRESEKKRKEDGPTFALAGELVAQHVDLIDGAVLFEHFAQIVLVHGARNLTDEHLDGVAVRLVHAIAAAAVHPVPPKKKPKITKKKSISDIIDKIHSTHKVATLLETGHLQKKRCSTMVAAAKRERERERERKEEEERKMKGTKRAKRRAVCN